MTTLFTVTLQNMGSDFESTNTDKMLRAPAHTQISLRTKKAFYAKKVIACPSVCACVRALRLNNSCVCSFEGGRHNQGNDCPFARERKVTQNDTKKKASLEHRSSTFDHDKMLKYFVNKLLEIAEVCTLTVS